jgi:hypothetical protein
VVVVAVSVAFVDAKAWRAADSDQKLTNVLTSNSAEV